MESCNYCSGKNTSIIDTRMFYSRKNSTLIPGIEVEIDDGELCVYAVADTYEPNFQEQYIPINFCPMCGRRI